MLDYVLIFLLVYIFVRILASKTIADSKPLEACKLHDWERVGIVDKTGAVEYKLICKKCGGEPG